MHEKTSCPTSCSRTLVSGTASWSTSRMTPARSHPALCTQATPDWPLLVLIARLPGHHAHQLLMLPMATRCFCEKANKARTTFFQESHAKPHEICLDLIKQTTPQFRTMFFEKLGIEGLHFKSTEHLFATQWLVYQKVILAVLDIQYHKNQCKMKETVSCGHIFEQQKDRRITSINLPGARCIFITNITGIQMTEQASISHPSTMDQPG